MHRADDRSSILHAGHSIARRFAERFCAAWPDSGRGPNNHCSLDSSFSRIVSTIWLLGSSRPEFLEDSMMPSMRNKKSPDNVSNGYQKYPAVRSQAFTSLSFIPGLFVESFPGQCKCKQTIASCVMPASQVICIIARKATTFFVHLYRQIWMRQKGLSVIDGEVSANALDEIEWPSAAG